MGTLPFTAKYYVSYDIFSRDDRLYRPSGTSYYFGSIFQQTIVNGLVLVIWLLDEILKLSVRKIDRKISSRLVYLPGQTRRDDANPGLWLSHVHG